MVQLKTVKAIPLLRNTVKSKAGGYLNLSYILEMLFKINHLKRFDLCNCMLPSYDHTYLNFLCPEPFFVLASDKYQSR